jgi:hypothetical protein
MAASYTLDEITRQMHVLNMEAEGADVQALEINSALRYQFDFF